MTIKSNHKHVDIEGLVFLPYLHDWKLESNLVSLISFACKAFSAEPPLFAKPKNPLPTPPPPIRTQSPPNGPCLCMLMYVIYVNLYIVYVYVESSILCRRLQLYVFIQEVHI